MSARKDFIEYEAVLKYCCSKTTGDYEQAINYGKLSGLFTTDNKLTPMGKTVAQYVVDGLAA
tara:strand:+ start:14 stop:199 length:186 start_codon:yes stop_codon:yes gene_type:complete